MYPNSHMTEEDIERHKDWIRKKQKQSFSIGVRVCMPHYVAQAILELQIHLPLSPK